MALETRRSALSVGEVESELKEITRPHQLGLHLEIPPEHLERFEQDYRDDVIRQRAEVINYWLRNFANATWNTLATAVEKVGGHSLLVTRLRDLAQRFSQDNDTVEESDFQTPPESPTLANEEEDIFEHISSLPSLRTGTPVDSDDTLLASATTKLKLEFSALFTKVRLSLQKLQVSAESVLSHLRSIEAIGPRFEAVYMSRRSESFSGTISRPVRTLEDLFPAIAPYCSWFNHLLVENIIDTFCDDDDKLQQKWEKFKDKFTKYCEARLHKCPQDQFGEDHAPPDTTPIVMKIDYEWKTVKVKQLTVIRDAVSQVFKIKPYNLYLRAVQNGCVELLFHVPFPVCYGFICPSVEQIAGLHRNRVLQIRCDPSVISAMDIATRLAKIGDDIATHLAKTGDEIDDMTKPVPKFSNLVDIAQYLSENVLEAYKQYKEQISTDTLQFGNHLRKLGDKYQVRLRTIRVAEHFRILGDEFQTELFAPMYFTQLLPILIAAFMLYNLPHPLNKVVFYASFVGSGFLLFRLWRKNHSIRGLSIRV